MKIINGRQTYFNVNPIFPKRWSSRVMSGEELSEEEINTLFEAARWAPSSYNNQSWRFIYARRNTENWNNFLKLLYEPNKVWAQFAAVLIVVVSKKTFDYDEKPSRTHSFDTGAAWENLALQGSIYGLVVHGMQGFDYDRAKLDLQIPDDYQVEVMVAVGKPGEKEDFSEAIQSGEVPNSRKDYNQIVFEGKFSI